jgi:hypothetical protein
LSLSDLNYSNDVHFAVRAGTRENMLKLLTDEDFNNRLLRGVLRRQPQLDIVHVQDVLTREERDDDRKVLAWAAAEQRLLLTHDVTTMRPYAETRVAAGLPMPGVFEVSQYLPIGQAIEEILLLAECSREGEGEGQIHFLPLK